MITVSSSFLRRILVYGSADCAILVTLSSGGYTAHGSGLDGATGVALIEVYEVP